VAETETIAVLTVAVATMAAVVAEMERAGRRNDENIVKKVVAIVVGFPVLDWLGVAV